MKAVDSCTLKTVDAVLNSFLEQYKKERENLNFLQSFVFIHSSSATNLN